MAYPEVCWKMVLYFNTKITPRSNPTSDGYAKMYCDMVLHFNTSNTNTKQHSY